MTRADTEVNGLSEVMSEAEAQEYRSAPLVPLADRDAVHKITRLRLITSPGAPVWDISYVWGVSRDGKKVRVDMPEWQLPRQGRGAWSSALLAMFQEQGRFAKAMGLWKPGVVSKLW